MEKEHVIFGILLGCNVPNTTDLEAKKIVEYARKREDYNERLCDNLSDPVTFLVKNCAEDVFGINPRYARPNNNLKRALTISFEYLTGLHYSPSEMKKEKVKV